MPDIRSIQIPKRMRALTKDPRGYPIPFIVLRQTDGKPCFTINHDLVRARCIREKRCAICGTRMHSELWFVGGPLSAFHKNGAYQDSALHHECMQYAIQVCPYLAAPVYSGRIDARTVDITKLPKGCPAIFLDNTTLPDRPALFTCVAARGFTITENGYLQPKRPYLAIEFWQHGQRLKDMHAFPLVLDAFRAVGEELQS